MTEEETEEAVEEKEKDNLNKIEEVPAGTKIQKIKRCYNRKERNTGRCRKAA